MKFGTFSNKRNLVSALALSVAAFAPATGGAGEVTLKSADGTVNLVGEFVAFSDNNYVIRTGLGDLRISATRVRCEGADCPDIGGTAEADVKISGSDAVGEGVMPLLLSGYAAFLGAEATQTATGTRGQFVTEMVGEEGFGDPMGAYLVSSTSSNDAFRTLLDNTTQIGMSDRRISPGEARALRDAGAGNMIDPSQENIIAVDSLVVIRHPDNPVDTLSMEDLRGIYSGQITNWAELGGNDAPIQVLDWPADSGTRGVFEEQLFGDTPPPLRASAIEVTDNNEMAALVNQNENAIGFVGYAFQRGAKPITLINECGLSMVPDAFSARTEEYALQRFLYLYNRAELDDQSRDFVEYAISDAADEVIAKAGFIDLGIDRRAQPLDGDRAKQLLNPNVDDFEGGVMRAMLSDMVEYDRLSTTFRFRTGSQRLDPRGQLNLERLAHYLESEPSGTKILFVGFTDDVGAFESNRELSVDRAAQVMSELQNYAGDRLGDIDMQVTGYGEIAPAACNSTENQRRINRRVEVWIQNPNS
ncbi:phosphate ABC transporter substrate-binding/OmpA family protein [Loktanella agnita]|uniref:phosphate ABC transporter substrate-binding/OmpA family protein n=1 Tax=Loktanella agnita TaxID=287097 RepID=UPI003989BA73